MKQGVTVSVIAVAVAVMFIVISTATIFGTRSIKSATYEEYMGKLKRVEDAVNFYQNTNDSLPITGEGITKEGLDTDFIQVITNNGDENNQLYVADMSSMIISNVNIGQGTLQDGDVFLIAENSGNVYYLRGLEYKGNRYYCYVR